MSFITFYTKGLSPSGKTKIWEVYPASSTAVGQGQALGTISWHGPLATICFLSVA